MDHEFRGDGEDPVQTYHDALRSLVENPTSRDALTSAASYAIALGELHLAACYLEELPSNSVRVSSDVIDWASSPDVRRRHSGLKRRRNPAELARICQLALYANGRVLEMGSGSGDLAIAMAMCGANVYAVDIDPIAIEVGRARVNALGLSSCRFRLADGATTGLPNSSFDTVVVAEVLEHAADPKALLVEARRLVRSGGHILVSVPNEYAVPDWDHHRIWSKRVLERVVIEVFDTRPTWIPGVPRQWLACGIQVEKEETERGNAADSDLDAYFLPPLQCEPLNDYPLVSVVIPTHNGDVSSVL